MSLTSESQVLAVAKLVHSVQQLVTASPDARQFGQVLVRAAAENQKATLTAHQTAAPTTRALSNTNMQSATPLPAESAPTSCAGPHDAKDPSATQQKPAAHEVWVWDQVQDIVVLGLGSFGTYSSLILTGKQTMAESTRAAPRLYQLALALSLPSLLQANNTQNQTARSSSIKDMNPTPEPSNSAPPSPPPTSSLDSFGVPTKRDPIAKGVPTMATICFYDPAFDAFDLSLLQHFGCKAGRSAQIVQSAAWVQTATSTAPIVAEMASDGASLHDTSGPESAILQALGPASTGEWVVQRPTLFYMPCCPRDLYAAVIAQNRAAGTLHNVCILGNSLRSLKDSNQLLQLLTSFGQAPGAIKPSFMQALQQQQSRAPFLAAPTATAPTTRPTSTWGGPAGVSSGSVQATSTDPEAKRVNQGSRSAANEGQLLAGSGMASNAGTRTKIPEEDDATEGPELVMADLLATKGAVVEVFAPDFSAHGVAVGLHLFPCVLGPV